jgi:hypothetical protein
MNVYYLAAGIMSLFATSAHFFTGEIWIFPHLQGRGLPRTLFGEPYVTLRILRVVWHFVTIDFVVSAVALFLLATSYPSEGSAMTAKLISLHFAGYVLAVLVVAVGRPKDLLRAPQLLVFATIAALTWWGAS